MTEFVLSRVRTRRRRPPTSRELLALLCFGALISQTAWLAVQIAKGTLALLIVLPMYPLLWLLLRRNLEVARHYERLGRPLPTDTSDWLLTALLWAMQVLLWVVV